MVLWIVPVTGETFTLYALTRSRPDAVIEVGQAELGKSADIDRTIALKLRNVLEGLLSRAAASVSAAPTVAATQPPVTRARWPQAIWRLGLVGAAGVGTNARAEAGLGARFHAGGLRWEASALVALATTIELGNDPAVEASEWDFGFRFTGLHAAGPRLAVGGLVEAGARRLFAQASLPNGAINQARVLVPVLWSGPEIRWSLGGRMEICAAAGVEVALQRQRFSIAGVPVADMGRVRFLSLVALVALL